MLADVEFDIAYTSDLSRAVETAETVLAGQSSPVSLVVDNGLREISDGIYEGWSIAAAVEADPRMVSLTRTYGPPVITTFGPPRSRPLTALAGTAAWYQRTSVESIASSPPAPASSDRCGERRCR